MLSAVIGALPEQTGLRNFGLGARSPSSHGVKVKLQTPPVSYIRATLMRRVLVTGAFDVHAAHWQRSHR
jgi:hypothetical protein